MASGSERARASASALARTGLVGHPSDGYGGATLAVTLRNFEAHVEATSAPRLEIDGEWPEGGTRLIAATLKRFASEYGPLEQSVRIRYRSTIPREVGLGGSSALVIAALRALARLHATTIGADVLPQLALAIETDELGIAAGLQDRVVQTYGGLMHMDFATHSYERLEPALLPPLFVAWHPSAGGASGAAHAGVRARFERGERRIVQAMRTLAQLAHGAKTALEASDHAAFAAALDAGYDVRASIFDLDPRHTAMIEHARALGLPATYTGSGGAIAGIAADHAAVAELTRRLAAADICVEPARVG